MIKVLNMKNSSSWGSKYSETSMVQNPMQSQTFSNINLQTISLHHPSTFSSLSITRRI